MYEIQIETEDRWHNLSDFDNWHADWGMEISLPDGVEYTADDVGRVMNTIMHRLKTARIEYA